MIFNQDKSPEWLDGSVFDAFKAFIELFLSRVVWLCGIVVVVLYFFAEAPNSDYDWTASTIFSEVVWLAAFTAFFEVVIRRYYHRIGDGPEAEGTRAVLENNKKKTGKPDG
jgi:hypothetical protein